MSKDNENPLNGTKYTKGTEEFDVLRNKVEGLLETYRLEVTKVMVEAAQLEIEKITDSLVAAMHECANDEAEVTYIQLTENRSWRKKLSEKNIIGNAVHLMFSHRLDSNFFSTFQ